MALNRILNTSLIGIFLVASLALQSKVHFFDDAKDFGGLPENTKAPAFTLKSVEGKVVSLSDYRGRPVVVDFFATWCGPCKQEMMALKAWRKKRSKLGLPEILVVIVSVDREIDDIEHYLKTHDNPFTVLLDPTSEVANLYKVKGLPTIYFIGGDGTILDTTVGAQPGLTFTFDRLARKNGGNK